MQTSATGSPATIRVPTIGPPFAAAPRPGAGVSGMIAGKKCGTLRVSSCVIVGGLGSLT